jgi:hypothetical protein
MSEQTPQTDPLYTDDNPEVEVLQDGKPINGADELATVDDGFAGDIDPEASPEAKAMHAKVMDLRDRIDETYMEMAQILHQIWDKSIYQQLGYKTWKEYCEEALDFKIRKAQYLVQIWGWIGNLSDETREKLFGIGWAKLKELVGIINDENVDEWVARALEMNVLEITEAARAYLSSGDGGEPGDPGTAGQSEFKNISFRLAADQHDLALKALEKAGEMAKSDKKGYLLGLICQDFLTANATPTGEEALRQMIKRMESLTGMKLVAFSNDMEEVIYGNATIDKLLNSDGDA